MKKTIQFAFLILTGFLSLYSIAYAQSNPAYKEIRPRIVNIINFIRQVGDSPAHGKESRFEAISINCENRLRLKFFGGK